MYTSYFAQLKNLPENFIPISICGKAPEWYTGLQYKKFAPKYTFFMQWEKTHDNDYYIRCFNEQVLNKLNIEIVKQDLLKLISTIDNYQEKEICLLCYEKPSDFCHRHLVAKWLNDNGIECKEWEKNK